MGFKIDDVVPVSITIGEAVVSQQGFGVPLILSESIRSENRVDSFSSASAMLEAGYISTDREYLMGKAIFDQVSKLGKSVPTIKVGKKLSDNNAVITITFDASATAGTFTLDIKDVDGDTTDTSDPIAYDAVAGAVETGIEACTNVTGVTVALLGTQAGDKKGFTITFDDVVDDTTNFQCTAVNVGSLTSVTSGSAAQTAYGSAVETITAAYAAVKAEDDDFYVCLLGSEVKADILELAGITSTEKKIFYYLTRDPDVKSGAADNVEEELRTLGYENQILCYNELAGTYANCAWVGATLPDNLYGINTCYYPLVGITGDTLTETNITNLIAGNINLFLNDGDDVVVPGTFAGKSGNQGGLTASGGYIANVVASDFLSARSTEGVYQLIKSSTKIPFDARGSFSIKTKIESILDIYGVQAKIITPGTITVVMPDLDSYDSAKKAARWLDGVAANGSLSGAVSKISISLKLAV